MEDTKLIAKKRDLQGSSNARRLRRAGTLPGVIYGDGEAATAIELNMHDFEQLLHHHTSETMLVEMTLEGQGDVTVLVKDVQHHPVTSDPMHVDMQKIAADKPIQVDIQLDPVGEATGVKTGGTLDLVMHTIAIECLPGDLVESIEVDVAEMEIGDSLQVSDLKLGAKLKLLGDEDAIIISVSAPRAEEEEEEEAIEGAEGAEPEVINEKKDDEGE
jgi:large subunit ribosomal protein L25